MTTTLHTPNSTLAHLWARGAEFLGCRYAIMGGAMSWVSERNLVAALSNAGAFGVIACGSMPPELLEKEIDTMNEILPEMKFFVLPGGHAAVSTTHIARCVCRRAERWCVNLQEQNLFVDPLVIKYLNRLSDYLFVLARYIGHLLQVDEIAWRPRL